MTATGRLIELMGSMRFAVSLLSVIAIASVAGTIVRQGEPYANYLNQFGPFWFRVFESIGLYSVYTASWFVVILAFLVVSVSLCVWKNAPWMLREMANFREERREESLRHLPHHALIRSDFEPSDAIRRAAEVLSREGFATRSTPDPRAARLAAKSGSAHRIGYVCAHVAIVAICVGGLLDSNLPLKARLALGEVRTAPQNALLSQIRPESRLAADNPTFRGNVFIPEGQSSDYAVLNVADGILLQQLPYTLSLKKFHIEHYSTGQPKVFASDVIVTDKETGRSFEARIEVNKPLVYRGVAAYQASFDDGGTAVRLTGHHLLAPGSKTLDFTGRVGEAMDFRYGGEAYRLEITGFRAFNIEDVGSPVAPAAASNGGGTGESVANDSPPSSEAIGVVERIRRQLGSAREAAPRRELRNVGPSYSYKLRDAAGQAREYNTYMLPLAVDGRWMAMTGMREQPADAFRYLRIPIDEDGRLDGFLQVRAGLLTEALRGEAARRFARDAMTGTAISETLRERLAESAERTLETFSRQGYQAVAEFLERSVPAADREKAADVYLRVLHGAAWEAWQRARATSGLARLEPTPERTRFVQDALNAVSDSFHFGVPVYLALREYDEVKASVFQTTRSPGRNIVYLGCALLIIGVFTLVYIRERRVWLIAKPGGEVVMGASCNRRTLDFDREFAGLAAAVRNALETPAGRDAPMRKSPTGAEHGTR